MEKSFLRFVCENKHLFCIECSCLMQIELSLNECRMSVI